jgi:hypothetical protein
MAVKVMGQDTIIQATEKLQSFIGTPINNNSFPVNTGTISHTESAKVNYVERCLTACPGDLITISSANTYSEGDTYIRLFQGETQVASDDNSTGTLQANLIYQTSPYSPCQEYCAHLGCYGDQTCVVYATASIGIAPIPQFISYVQPLNGGTPSLTLHNLTITGFGSDDFIGGMLYSFGNLQLTISFCDLQLNYGDWGATFYMEQNMAQTVIHHCLLLGTDSYGELVFIGNISNVDIHHSTIASEIVFTQYGAHDNISISDNLLAFSTLIFDSTTTNGLSITNNVFWYYNYSLIEVFRQATNVTILNNIIHVIKWTDIPLPMISVGSGSKSVRIHNLTVQGNTFSTSNVI